MSNYQMPTSKKSHYEKHYGQIQVCGIEDNKVFVLWRDVDFKGLPLVDAKGVLIPPRKLPPLKLENCLPVIKPKGQFAATLSGDRLYNIRPINGLYRGRFKEFMSPRDTPPVPKMSSGNYPHLTFSPMFVLEGDEKDMIVSYRYPGLRYAFEAGETDDGKPVLVYAMRSIENSKAMLQVDEFLKATGILSYGAISPTDNALPIFQRRALDANRPLNILMENGFVKNITPNQAADFGTTENLANGKEE